VTASAMVAPYGRTGEDTVTLLRFAIYRWVASSKEGSPNMPFGGCA